MANRPPKKPVGDSIRDLINPALEDERRQKTQLDLLDAEFLEIALHFPGMMRSKFQEVFNQAALRMPENKNIFIIEQLTDIDSMTGQPRYSPILGFPILINTDFTNFSANEIKELPHYIMLHETARIENVSLKLGGLTPEETKSGMRPHLIIDGSKTYEQGAMENGLMYPNLPDIPDIKPAPEAPKTPEEPETPKTPKAFDPKTPRRFNFDE